MIARPQNLPQVFVVDASNSDYRELVDSMTDEGYRVEVCPSGRAALRKCLRVMGRDLSR